MAEGAILPAGMLGAHIPSMTKIWLSVFALGAALVVPVAAQTTAIQNVSVVDVEAGRLIPAQTVVVSGNRISRMGPASGVVVESGARIIDGTGKFLIPGLWDMHVHAATPWFGAYFMPLLVAHGVTGVREMFSATAAVDVWRKRIGSGESVGPRVGQFGSLVDGTPPIWPGSVVANSAADGRRIVDSLKAARVEFVKVYSRLSPEAFRAIAARSKEVGISFAGHIPSLVAAREAARLGQRTVEHLTQVLLACSTREEEFLDQSQRAVASAKGWDSAGVVSRGRVEALVASYDAKRCEQVADAFKAAGTYLVPTTTVLRSIANLDDPRLATDPRLKYIPGFLKDGWDPKKDFRFSMFQPADWALRKLLHARELEVLRLLHRRGVKFLAGTDLANPFIFAGASLHDELGLLVSIGMTPLQALQSATIEPARFLGVADSLGSVGAGRVADLVLLSANPLTEIGNVAKIEVVIANGRVFDAAARQAMFSAAEALAARPPS